ncbi:MAG: relaxase/mobilization nuclease domain-containing protein [Halarcobacter sp.]
MIAKYFKGGKSKSGAVEYLLNEREQLGTARTLRGNPELTKQLIKENSNKLKYRSGVIAFEGKKPSQEVINDVIEHFEKSTFAGLEKEQYNYLMVEHTDTDNYHIHFIIPRLELTSGKAYNPHYHKQDQTRLLKVQEYLNAKHGLSSAFSEEKRQLLRVNTKEKKNDTKQQIHQVILGNIKSGHIQNANELKQFFIDSGATVSRHGKDYITVQFGTEKHKLKGEIYGKSFTTIDSIKETIKTTEREHKPTTRAELRELKQELDRLMEFKAETNRTKYPKREQDYTREHRPRIRDTKKKQDLQVHRDNSRELDNRSINRGLYNIREITPLDNSTRKESDRQKGRKLDKEQPVQIRQRDKHSLDKGKVNDRTRENIKRRIERSRAEREETTRGIAAAIESVHTELNRSYRDIQDEYKRDTRDIQERIKTVGRKQQDYNEQSGNNWKEAEQLERTVENIEPTISRYARFKQRVTSYIKVAREHISNAYEELKERYSNNFIFKQDDLETSFATQDTKKDILGREMSYKDLERVQSQFDISATRDIQQEAQREQERQQQRSRSHGMSMRM